jgi:hypothetical protein
LNADDLKTLPKTQIATAAQTLKPEEFTFLVKTLNETDDKLRYNAFLLLQVASKNSSALYHYWDVLEAKLGSDNSYQRSIGVMLLAENVRWDSEGKFGGALPKFLAGCSDEKFITARQTLQSLVAIVKSTNKYNAAIKQAVSGLQFGQYKENQQSLLKKDAAAVLAALAGK